MGRPDLGDYYPGDDVVDHIGLPVWGYQRADRRWFGRERTFAQALEEKYLLVERFDKPVIIAEFGVSGSGRYERAWLGSYLDDLRAYPLVTTVAYFNDREPYHWPDGLGSPDWRKRPAVIGLD
jgi:beta-mannanase